MPFGLKNKEAIPTFIDSDIHSLELFNTDMSLEEMESTLSVDLSNGTGYLQDAIAAWNNRCKRRRISSFCQDNMDEFSKNCWNSMDYEDPIVKFGSLRQDYSPVADRNPLQNWLNSTDKRWTAPVEKMPGEHEYQINQPFSSSFTHMDSTTKDPQEEKDPSVIKKNCCVIKKVVYPFEMVKPGSIEGDVTLNDINKRMLMRPTRPVMHPVGNFACRPCVTAGGLGLSGKAVVALTRIRTRGSGTVTIIRTRG